MRIASYFILLLFSISVIAKGQQAAEPTAVVQFEKMVHDFGKIKQGRPVPYNFQFKNIDSKPVIIINAMTTSGCIVASKPEQPIEPGKTAVINVQYDAAAMGKFNKSIYITIAGIEKMIILQVTGEVVEGRNK